MCMHYVGLQRRLGIYYYLTILELQLIMVILTSSRYIEFINCVQTLENRLIRINYQTFKTTMQSIAFNDNTQQFTNNNQLFKIISRRLAIVHRPMINSRYA